jgi:hypothetical protein
VANKVKIEEADLFMCSWKRWSNEVLQFSDIWMTLSLDAKKWLLNEQKSQQQGNDNLKK